MIVNSDQWCDVKVDDYLAAMSRTRSMVADHDHAADDPKWTFAGLDPSGLVTGVAEKRVISDEATVGIYYFRRGADFVRAAEEMIAADERINGEFYVAPVYNRLIAQRPRDRHPQHRCRGGGHVRPGHPGRSRPVQVATGAAQGAGAMPVMAGPLAPRLLDDRVRAQPVRRRGEAQAMADALA